MLSQVEKQRRETDQTSTAYRAEPNLYRITDAAGPRPAPGPASPPGGPRGSSGRQLHLVRRGWVIALWLLLAAEGVRDSRQRSEASANRRYGLTLIVSIRRYPKKYQHEQERKPLSTRRAAISASKRRLFADASAFSSSIA